MIWQTYHDSADLPKAFAEEPYAPFDLMGLHLPEWEQQQLCEYSAMRHLYHHPELNTDPWIGFTSINQGIADDNVTLHFQTKAEIAAHLQTHDVLAWACNEFFAGDGRRLTVAEASDRIHPGVNAELHQLLKLAGLNTIPAFYNHGYEFLAHNYWCMSKALFAEYMAWSLPLVEHCLTQRGRGFFDRWHRATSYLHERLIMCWVAHRGLKVGLHRTPHAGNADAAREIERRRMIERNKEWVA